MHRTARYDAIMSALRVSSSCTVAELTARLGVSDETVRRDIKALAARGLVERVHGAVLLPDRSGEADFQKRMAQNAAEKKAIAELAVREIADGDTLMIDSGATTAYVARALLSRRNLFVVTNGTEIARILTRGSGNHVHLTGGEVRADDDGVFGDSAMAFLKNFRARCAILSIGAIHPEGGFMNYHLQEAELARAMIGQSSQVMVVADHTKFRNQAPVRVCGLDGVGTVVCDKWPPDALARPLLHHEVRILSAESQETSERDTRPVGA